MIDQRLGLSNGLDDGVFCPCCGGGPLEPFEDTFDIEGNTVAVAICLICSAIINRSSLERAIAAPGRLREMQARKLPSTYPDEDELRDSARGEIDTYGATLDVFKTRAVPDADLRQLVCAEVGFGCGALLHAAASRFGRCYGVDLAFDVAEESAGRLGLPGNAVLLQSIANIPERVDVVFAWHSFERVPRLYDLIAAIRSSLKPGGWLFFQVPLYRPGHIVDSHVSFLNRRAIAVLAEIEHYKLVSLWTEHRRSYLFALLRTHEA